MGLNLSTLLAPEGITVNVVSLSSCPLIRLLYRRL